LQTRAERNGSDYVLNGRKLWITNAKEAGIFVLFATVDPAAGYKGITAFLVEKEFPGFTVGKKEDKLGIRASSTCELILEDCRVPKENVLGEVGKGYKIAIETLNEGRIGIGAQMLGVARGAWECAAKYAQERKQFGKAISEFQGIQFQIAQMATEIEAARLMVYNAARMKDAGVPFVKEAAMAKLAAETVERMRSALDDDLNTAQAQAAIFEMVRAANAAFDAGEMHKDDVAPLLGAIDKFDEIFAVLADDDAPKVKTIVEWAKADGREKDITAEALALAGSGQLSDADIERKIAEMDGARKARNFKASDAIRAELIAAGILIENTKEGVRWRRK
jgi:alkylation response protein AidB-like acyl-CoA dehydrogenase